MRVSGDTRIDNKIEEWRERGDIPAAVSLVEAAIVAGDRSEATQQAASFLAQQDTPATSATKTLARAVLEGFPSPRLPVEVEARSTIQILKRRLRLNPRNTVIWVDLSRLYSSQGHQRKSIRSMEIALNLAPDNRFVLRSATRLFVHYDEPDRAHRILVGSPATRHDPWLNASELATANLLEISPRFIKTARVFLESQNFTPRDTAELAGALGTLEVEHGKAIQARKLFRQSLIDPNDNALAQANWAANKHRITSVDMSLIERTPLSFEAASWKSFWAGDWKVSFEQSQAWAEDEPFSSAPACHASFLAVSLLDDFVAGERIAKLGLQANPEENTLKNNLMVSYAYQGRLTEAETLFEEIRWQKADPYRSAAAGLLSSRRGDLSGAVEHYLAAMELAYEKREYQSGARAIFFLLNEMKFWSPGHRERISKLADLMLKNISTSEFVAYKEKLRSAGTPSVHPSMSVGREDETRLIVDTLLELTENNLAKVLKVSSIQSLT